MVPRTPRPLWTGVTCYEAISAREEPSLECGANVGVDAVLEERAVVFRVLLRLCNPLSLDLVDCGTRAQTICLHAPALAERLNRALCCERSICEMKRAIKQ